MTENATCARVLGFDVGKDSIVMFDSLTGTTQTVDNTLKALTRVLRRFGRDTLVVCEATGGYETALLTAATAPGVCPPIGRPAQDQRFPAFPAQPWQDRETRYAGDLTGKRDTLETQLLVSRASRRFQ